MDVTPTGRRKTKAAPRLGDGVAHDAGAAMWLAEAAASTLPDDARDPQVWRADEHAPPAGGKLAAVLNNAHGKTVMVKFSIKRNRAVAVAVA
ncbi:MAG: hypothetical protein ACT6S0_18110 [Roseateles sp.]|uniref:hypothetical protein n=1 Tax=Roseateles sp. TaxID=1971397 RepID=UPI004036C64C